MTWGEPYQFASHKKCHPLTQKLPERAMWARKLTLLCISLSVFVFLLFFAFSASAALTYYNTWNGWGDLGPDGDDLLNWTGATARDEAAGNWRVAIWKLRHESIAAQSNSSFTWTDHHIYHFTYIYNRTSGAASYTLDDAAINSTGGPTISGEAGSDRPFNMVYLYVKNTPGHKIVMNNLVINGVQLETVAGFDGELHIGDNGTSHETVKFIDTGENRLLAGDRITIEGDFVLENPAGSQGDKMQISTKLLYDPDLEGGSPEEGPTAVYAIGPYGLVAAGMLSLGAGIFAVMRRKET
jgi:hypothetical protein